MMMSHSPVQTFYPVGSIRVVVRQARDVAVSVHRAQWVFRVIDDLYAAAPTVPSGHVCVCRTMGPDVGDTEWNRHHTAHVSRNWWDDEIEGWETRDDN